MRLRNTLWLVIPNTAGFAALLVFDLEQNYFLTTQPALENYRFY